ncbi:MAG: hypothetical protein GJ680_18125 [Alteromonadaceae bacterium]|nr:hypothetical protein [Alteromonadaceae bacterium]
MALALATETTSTPIFSNWVERALPAYDSEGKPRFFEDDGETLIEGIYLDMPNDVYHALPALSSSKLKTFLVSPAHYYRSYLSAITRKRTNEQKNTLDAGTHSHTLILEPQGYYQTFSRDVVKSDFPDAYSSDVSIKEALKEYLESEANAEYEAQLAAYKKGDSTTQPKKKRVTVPSDINKVMDMLLTYEPSATFFRVLLEEHRNKQGAKGTRIYEGEEVVTYGGKIPVDAVVWEDAHRVAKTTRDHDEADAYFQYGLPEVAMIARCPRTGMMLKVKFDWLRFDDEAVDMKTTRSTNPVSFKHQIEDLHYDLQQEFYKYVASLLDVMINNFTFVATEYREADICQPFQLPERMVIKAKRTMVKALDEMKQCIDTQNWYGWSKEDCTFVFE